MKPVIVAGHVCVDLTPTLDAPPEMEPGRLIGVGPLAMSAGGCVGNTGRALAFLGIPTQLVASVGSDELGRVLVALLAASTADTTGMASVEDRGTSYSIVLDVPGRDRTIWHYIGANAAFDGSGVIDRLGVAAPSRGANASGAQDTILHVGYPTLLPALYADGGAALTRVVGSARAAGATISIDLAEFDPASEAAAVDWERLLARILPDVDVVKASLDDLEAMLPNRAGLEPIAWADVLVALGAAGAIVTAGADGLYVRTATAARIRGAARPLRDALPDWSGRELWAPSLATRVLATTGAGDAAAAGFLAGLAHGRGPAESTALAAAAAASRISGRPIGEAYRLAVSIQPAKAQRSGWSIGPDRVYHGPRDKEA